ncbi:MAG: glycoside hydrolase N-terminal domain-containing protein, partial [Bacteroidales bacterium]|nr:glycoside hydrolase N-terminal domain-containing protein [Bacteroidales bacterium]
MYNEVERREEWLKIGKHGIDFLENLRGPAFNLTSTDMKKFALLLIVPLVTTGCSTAQPTIHPSSHDLIFSRLAGSWDEGIPLGNGMLGALVWEKEGFLRISLDRADLWDLRPMENVYKEGYNYSWVQQQWEKDRYKKVQEAFDKPYDQSAGPSKIPAAALEIPLDGFGPVDSVRLYTHHGMCRIDWKNGISMEVFVDPEEPVGWFRITGADAEQEIKLVPPPYTLDAAPSSRNKVTGGQDLRRLEYPAGQLENGPGFLEYIQEGWNGFQYRVNCQLDREKEHITGCWSISSHYPEREQAARASELVEKALGNSFEKSREALLAWWEQYWSRSAVSLPDKVLEKQWYLEMYKFGAAAR